MVDRQLVAYCVSVRPKNLSIVWVTSEPPLRRLGRTAIQVVAKEPKVMQFSMLHHTRDGT